MQLVSRTVPGATRMGSVGTRGRGVKMVLLGPCFMMISPNCTDLFVVASVLLDTVKELSENGFIL